MVHQDHGIGRFQGLETLEVGGMRREFMVLAYQGGDKLKVPVDAFDRVQKYASAEGARPVVDKLGSGSWDKTKKRVKKAMRDMAAELLKLYAARVMSNTLEAAPWGDGSIEILRGAATEATADLKTRHECIVVWGSLTLADALFRAGLVDVLRLRVVPVLIGAGRPFTPADLGDRPLELDHVAPHPSGHLGLTYRLN